MIERRLTIREIAQIMGVSKSTVFLDLTERLPRIDLTTYSKVRHILNYHKAVRTIRGGISTARKRKNRGRGD